MDYQLILKKHKKNSQKFCNDQEKHKKNLIKFNGSNIYPAEQVKNLDVTLD